MAKAPPIQYSEEIAEAICRRIAEGESLRRICKDGDMPSFAAVMKWLYYDKHPGFRDCYALAREMQADCKFDEIEELADAEPERGPDGRIDPAWVTHRRNVISTKQWRAAKLKPKAYGEKIDHNHQGDMTFIVETGVPRPNDDE